MSEPGPLIAIGGHEDRTGRRAILRVVAAHLGGRPLALITAASRHPEGYVDQYTTAFADLGVTILPVPLDVQGGAGVIAQAGGVFLTGGKQLRLVSRLNELALTPVLHSAWTSGCVIAGTSAGASALAARMLVRGRGDRPLTGGDVRLGAGLGFVSGMIIDQHFVQRGRASRLRAAVALEPEELGVGIDEDTAVEIGGGRLLVHGAGAVTIIDAREAAVRPAAGARPATLRGARLEVLAAGDSITLDP